jgi:gamma-butyrobetaine dioxygenase
MDAMRIVDARGEGEGVRLAWADGTVAVYPWLWLRDACHYEACGDTARGRRFLRLIDVPAEVRPSAPPTIRPEGLVIVWAPDRHASRYDSAWLRENRPGAPDPEAIPRTPWDARIGRDLPDLPWPAEPGEDDLLALLRPLVEFGFVRLTGLGTELAVTEGLVGRLGPIQVTSYGRMFDIVPEPGSEILSQTGVALAPHTDEPFRYAPPGIVAFHCVVAGEGGATILVDGLHVAETLRREDPASFRILATVPQRFHRALPGAFDLADEAVPIALDAAGSIAGIRFAERSFAPLRLAPDRIAEVLAARRAMLERIHDPANRLVLPLRPGDLLFFDNHRVLHGRTAFTGTRHLRQCSVAREDVHSLLRTLLRRRGSTSGPLPRGALA